MRWGRLQWWLYFVFRPWIWSLLFPIVSAFMPHYCLSSVRALPVSPFGAILLYISSGIFPGAKNLTLDLSHPTYVLWQTGCHGDWAGCFHWKFQVGAAKFFLRKLACVLPLKLDGYDKYTLSNRMENSMPGLYLQTCRLSAVCLIRQCSSAQHLMKMRRRKKKSKKPNRKWNAQAAFITRRAKSIAVNQQDKVTRHTAVWT